jgi:hypothetical protein
MIYFSITQGHHGLPRHLAPGRLQPLHLLGRRRRHLLGLGGRWRRHLLRLGGWGRRLLLGLSGRGWRHLDGSPDAMRFLEEGEALGFTSW